MRAALVTFYLQDCRVRASVCHCSSWEGAHISTSLPVPHLLLLAPPCHVLDFCTFILVIAAVLVYLRKRAKIVTILLFNDRAYQPLDRFGCRSPDIFLFVFGSAPIVLLCHCLSCHLPVQVFSGVNVVMCRHRHCTQECCRFFADTSILLFYNFGLKFYKGILFLLSLIWNDDYLQYNLSIYL